MGFLSQTIFFLVSFVKRKQKIMFKLHYFIISVIFIKIIECGRQISSNDFNQSSVGSAAEVRAVARDATKLYVEAGPIQIFRWLSR